MFQLKKKPSQSRRYIQIYTKDNLIYDGLWDDLPFAEDIIIEKSITFFDDPSPCYIHRSAVRIRLLSEMEEAIHGHYDCVPSEWLTILSENIGCNIDHVIFSDKY